MKSNRGRDTIPELSVRRTIHSLGLRYRVDYRPWPKSRMRIDVAFPSKKIAVFVDGCFWHGCPKHATYPKSNSGYWLPKLQRNIERDLESNAVLRDGGWIVLRFWEHEEPAQVAAVVQKAVDFRWPGSRGRNVRQAGSP